MEASDEGWRSLHPASVAVNLIPTLWRAVRTMWPLVLAVLWGGADANLAWFEVFLLVVLFGSPIRRVVLHWLTLRYRVADGRLEIRSGLINRQVRVLSPDRIQNVELVRNLFHRASGLVELRVETASGGDVEGLLSALSEAEATRLMDALAAARRGARAAPEVPPVEQVLVENGPMDLLKYGLSTARLSLAVVALGALYEAAITSDPNRMTSTANMLGVIGAATALLALVLGAWLVGAGTSLVRHWNFKLAIQGDRLVAEEGLFTRRRVELSSDKVQLVSVSEPLVRRWLGFGTLHIETAALREGEGGTQTAEAVIPVLETGRFAELLALALPGAPDIAGLTLAPPHPRAVRRALLATAVRTGLFVGLVAWFFFPWGLLAAALVPVTLFGTWFDHRMQGWWIGPEHLVSRTGWWVRTTRVVARDKLQSLELHQGPLARRWDLARLHVRVAGSQVALPMLAFDEALDLEADLSASVGVAPPRQHAAPLLPHDEHAAPEQQPGQGLGNETHQDQRPEQHAPPGAEPEAVPEPAEPREQGGPQGEASGDPEHGGQGAHPPVEPLLPHHGQADLEQHHERVDHEQRADDDMQGADEAAGEGSREGRTGDTGTGNPQS